MVAESIETAAIAGVVDRPRLRRILDAPSVRVCVVQGPSGSGKTTLLRSWAARQSPGSRVIWVSLAEGVTGRHAFWQHVAATARRLGGMPRDAAARVRNQLSIAVDPVRIAVGVLADAGPVTFVLDAYEHLGDATSAVDDDLARLLAAVPGLRLIVTTRGATALADLELPGRDIVRVIALGELALTPQEIGALIAEQAGIEDERLTASVANATHGFALTVRAAVLALAQLGRIPGLGSGEWDAIVAARLGSLLPDAAAVRFVTETSIPPHVDAELAGRLTGHPDATGMLDTLERNGFGRWIPYARHRPVFQYVETIRDSFRAEAAAGDADGFRRCCVVAAGWLLENEEVDQALQLAIEGGDYAFADRIFVSLVIGNPDSYLTDRFLPALRGVPEEALAAHPMLAFGLGLALLVNPILRPEAPRILQIAIDSTAQPFYIEPAVDAFSLVSMRAVARRLAGDARGSAEASVEAMRMLDAIPPETVAQAGEHVGTILRQLGLSLLQVGRIDEAIAATGRSVALCTSQAARNYSIVCAAGATAFAGDIVRARALQATIDHRSWPEEFRGSSMNALGLVADGYACLDALDFAGALDVLREADSYLPTVGFWPFLTAISVSARHGLGQAGAEARRVTSALDVRVPPPSVGDNMATEHLRAVLAQAWIASGDVRTARRLLSGQGPGGEAPDSPHLAAARVACLLAEERDRAAFETACELVGLKGHTHRTRAAVQTVGAVAAVRQREPDTALSWLEDAAIVWEIYGPRAHVAFLDPRDRRMLGDAFSSQGSESLRRYLEMPAHVLESQRPSVALTPREQAVLSALAVHSSTREIADALVVSPHTVKGQLQGIYRKLRVSSRTSAIAVAQELGLLEPVD